jgi:hypothetical protein
MSTHSVRPARAQSSRCPFIEIQQTTEPRTPTDPSCACANHPGLDESILQSLVIPLAMVVIDEFSEYLSEVALAEGHHPIEAFVVVATCVAHTPHAAIGV